MTAVGFTIAPIKASGKHEVYRISADGQIDQALTDMSGGMDYELSPTEDRLLLTHSSITRQPDLFVQAATPAAESDTPSRIPLQKSLRPSIDCARRGRWFRRSMALRRFIHVYQDKSKLNGPASCGHVCSWCGLFAGSAFWLVKLFPRNDVP